jgi:hypothetical protein
MGHGAKSGMSTLSPYYLRIAIVFCAVVGLYDILYVIALHLDDKRVALALRPISDGIVIYPDFITPYGAVQAYLEGKQAIIYDHPKFTAFLNELYAFRFKFELQPFLYPPIWILMLLPLGLLPAYTACLVFMVATAAASAFESRRALWSWLAVATSPPAVWVVLSGQNTFLYVALMYGGMRLLEKSPVAAGILLGLVVYKPQICLLVPLALFACRQWTALASMIATAAVLLLASLAVFGLEFWIDYFHMTRQLSEPPMLDYWASDMALFNISSFVGARRLQLPDAAAIAIQLGAAALGAGAVWFAFRYHSAGPARTGVLMAATLLVSPYSIHYDLMLLLPAALLLYRQGATTGFYPLEPLIYPVLWLMPIAILWFNYRLPLPFAPLVVLTFALIAVMRLRADRSGMIGP